MKLDHLLKSAEAFEKLASINFADICKNYGAAIKAEANGGLKSLSRLLAGNPSSKGLKQLETSFKQILEFASDLEPSGADIGIQNLRSAIGNATFYTSSMNTGTGFEQVTRAGGAWSPSAYLNRIISHVDKLEKWYNYSEQQNKNQKHNSLFPST